MRTMPHKGLALLALTLFACLAGTVGWVAKREHRASLSAALAPVQGDQTLPATPPGVSPLEEEEPITPWTGPPLPTGPAQSSNPEAQATSPEPNRVSLLSPRVISTPDGGLIAVGFAPKKGALLERFDSEGRPEWGGEGRGQELDGVVAITSLEPSEDGGCYLAGAWSGAGSAKPEDQTAFVARFDNQGHALWRAYQGPLLRFGDPGEYTIRHLTPLQGGGCVAMGTAHEPDGDHAWVLRLDGGGAPLWNRGAREGLCFNNGGNEALWGAAEIPGGGIVLIGQAGSEPTGLVGQPHGLKAEPRSPGPPFNFVPAVGDGWMLWLDAQGRSLMDQGNSGSGLRYTGVHLAEVAADGFGRVFAVGSAWLSPQEGSGGYLLVITAEDFSRTQMRPEESWRRQTLASSPKTYLGNAIFAAAGGGGFTHILPTPDGGCFLLGRAAPQGATRLETWAVQVGAKGPFKENAGMYAGEFLSDEGASSPLAMVPDGDGGTLLYPKHITPQAPLHLVRFARDGKLAWLGDPLIPGGAVALAPPSVQGGRFRILGFGGAGVWNQVFSASGQRLP